MERDGDALDAGLDVLARAVDQGADRVAFHGVGGIGLDEGGDFFQGRGWIDPFREILLI